VLLVDDSADHSDLLVREIRQNGHDVTCQRVDTAERLREALENTGWDLVIGDDRVSGFSALDAVAILKSMRLDIPFILVSGTLDDDLELKAFQAGVDDYLMKDNLHRLMPAIRRALREAEERRVRCMAEQALRESEERYRELVENANDVILSTDLEGNFIALNTAGELLSGYSREELRHMNMAQVLTPESLRRAKQRSGKSCLMGDRRPTSST
jgi:DNA-binding NtrC family response regulator